MSDVVIALDAHPTDSTVWECESPLRIIRSRGDILDAPHGILDMGEQ